MARLGAAAQRRRYWRDRDAHHLPSRRGEDLRPLTLEEFFAHPSAFHLRSKGLGKHILPTVDLLLSIGGRQMAASLDEIVARDGGWTAMAIKLSDGVYTRDPAVDHRLKRLIQVAQDTIKKPISDCRVLDLACLEGHYAIEFALRGAETIGIEGRSVSVTKCDFVKNDLGLTRATFLQDDVRTLSREKYGLFDIVI